jgi:site-specific DNA recombinase
MSSPAPSACIRYAVGYIRVSSEEQAKADRWSLVAQRKAIEQYCQQRGWTLHHYIYCDAGHSAKGSDLAKRPEFKRMLDDVKSGHVRCDVIVTHTLDRYARNLVVALTTLADLHEHGITYSSVTESDFDYSNPDKRLHLSILAMFAEYFSEKLSQHTRKGKKERAENGLPNGDVPYGYVNPDAGTERSGAGVFNTAVPVPVPEEAAHVRRAFETYATGSSTDLQIAKMLNAAGSRTRNKRAEGPRPWSKDTVAALLTNPFYAGWVTYRGKGVSRSAPGERTKGKHEPIISQELYAAVQAVRQARARHTARPERQKHNYLLAGLCICARCRDSLRVQSQPRGAYYRCTAVERQREGGCAARKRAVPARVLDAQMAEIMEHFKLAPDWRKRIMAAAVHDAERAAVEAERAQITRRLEKIRKLTINEIMTEAEYQREKAELTDRLARLTLPTDVEVEKAWELLDSLRRVWGHTATSVEDRAAICRQLFSRVVVDLDGKAITEIHLREEFAPLFAALPAQVYTNGGTDGIRTRDLLRDRQAC